MPWLMHLSRVGVRPWEWPLLTYADFISYKSTFMSEGV